jgi:hypothetical protein
MIGRSRRCRWSGKHHSDDSTPRLEQPSVRTIVRRLLMAVAAIIAVALALPRSALAGWPEGPRDCARRNGKTSCRPSTMVGQPDLTPVIGWQYV